MWKVWEVSTLEVALLCFGDVRRTPTWLTTRLHFFYCLLSSWDVGGFVAFVIVVCSCGGPSGISSVVLVYIGAFEFYHV